MATTYAVTLPDDEVEIMERLLAFYQPQYPNAHPGWLLATALTALAYLNKIGFSNEITERHCDEVLALGYAPTITVYEADNLPPPTHTTPTRTH